MRRNVTWAVSTAAAVVLLLSYRTSLHGPDGDRAGGAPSAGSASAQTTGSPADSSADSSADSPADSPAAGLAAGSAGVSGSFTGTAVPTRWGPVQVRIAVTDGRITAATAVRYPNQNPHDQQINAAAIPLLNAAAVRAQSADLDTISGATVTSQGYIASLQSAIDQAHL